MPDLSTEARARVEAAVQCFEDALCNVVREHADEPPTRGHASAALLGTVEAVVREARRDVGDECVDEIRGIMPHGRMRARVVDAVRRVAAARPSAPEVGHG